jgi:hypothetical protein
VSHQELTSDQTAQLASFTHSIRDDWDIPGILHALGTARLRVGATPADIAIATIKAAAQPSNRTPAIIPLDGDHWREHNRPLTTPQPPRRCAACSEYHGPGQPCPTRSHSDYAATAAAAMTQVRAAYTRATADLCPHGVPWHHCHQHTDHAIAGQVIHEETE